MALVPVRGAQTAPRAELEAALFVLSEAVREQVAEVNKYVFDVPSAPADSRAIFVQAADEMAKQMVDDWRKQPQQLLGFQWTGTTTFIEAPASLGNKT